jgi:DnaJ-class molecular chaperone
MPNTEDIYPTQGAKTMTAYGNYENWHRLGPDDVPEVEMTECDQCDGTGTHLRDEHDTGRKCHVCGGEGEVPVDHGEPDEDYEYEKRRDAQMGW